MCTIFQFRLQSDKSNGHFYTRRDGFCFAQEFSRSEVKDFIQCNRLEGLLKKKCVEFIVNYPPAPVLTHVVFVYRTVWTELAA